MSERFLPMTPLWWLPLAADGGLAKVTAPADLSVHVVEGGRVTDIENVAVGTVIVRDAEERFHHYRRIRANSIAVKEDDLVESGQIIGVVASVADDSVPSFLYGVTDVNGDWLDAAHFVAGALDPSELGLVPIGSDDVDPLYEERLASVAHTTSVATADTTIVVIEEEPETELAPPTVDAVEEEEHDDDGLVDADDADDADERDGREFEAAAPIVPEPEPEQPEQLEERGEEAQGDEVSVEKDDVLPISLPAKDVSSEPAAELSSDPLSGGGIPKGF